jgi:hypothetical protein
MDSSQSQLIGYAVQVVFAALTSFVLQWLKNQKWFPFLNAWSATWWKYTVSAIVAAAVAAGISFQFDPTIGRLIIDGLTWAAIGHALLAFCVSFATQHLSYEGMVKNGSASAAMPPPKAIALVLACVLAMGATGCAGSLRDRVRTAAVITSDTVLTLDQEERILYAGGAYGSDPAPAKAKHLAIGAKVDGAIVAVLVFERAAKAWPVSMPTLPTDVAKAQTDALAALTELALIVKDVPGNGKLLANIAKVKEKIGG